MRAEGTTKGHENAEGMALGCVRVDLTVRLGRGVEGINIAVAWHFTHASPLIERVLATFGIEAQSTKW